MQRRHGASRRRTLALGLAVSLGLFAVVAADVVVGGPLTRMDRAVAGWVVAHVEATVRHRWLGSWASAPGSVPVASAALVAGTLACGLLGRWRHGGFMFLSGVLGSLVGFGLKRTFGRARPDAYGDLAAFPSGHALLAVLVYGLVALFVGDALEKRHPQRGAGGWGAGLRVAWIGLSLGVGAARVLSGAHWVTDVLGGWFMGLALLAATRLAWARWGAPASRRSVTH